MQPKGHGICEGMHVHTCTGDNVIIRGLTSSIPAPYLAWSAIPWWLLCPPESPAFVITVVLVFLKPVFMCFSG
jgi:hypothetical protein